MYMSIQITGAAQIERKLRELEPKLRKKFLTAGLTRAAEPMRSAASANAEGMVGGDMGGRIARAITIRPIKPRRRGNIGVGVQIARRKAFVHIAKGKSNYLDKRTYIPSAIEYGHFLDNGSFAMPIPFMRTAFDAQAGTVLAGAQDEIRNAVEQAAKES